MVAKFWSVGDRLSRHGREVLVRGLGDRRQAPAHRVAREVEALGVDLTVRELVGAQRGLDLGVDRFRGEEVP
jgi:hypothetical protein